MQEVISSQEGGGEKKIEDKDVLSYNIELYKKINYTINGIKVDDPSYQFIKYKLDNTAIDALSAAGATALLVEGRKAYEEQTKGKSVQEIVNDPKVVGIATKDTDIQNSVLGDVTNPDEVSTNDAVRLWKENYYKSVNAANEQNIKEKLVPGDITNPDEVSPNDAVRLWKENYYKSVNAASEDKNKEEIKTVQESNNTNAELTPVPSVSTTTEVPITESAPIDWSKVELVPKEGELPKSDGSIDYVKYSPEERSVIGQEYNDSIIKSNSQEEIITNNISSGPLATEELQDSHVKLWKEEVKNSAEKVTALKTALENRKKGSMERLKALGLKGIDSYRNMPPRNKLLVGALFAGASVATGGLTSIVTKGLSAASYSRGFYEKILKAEEEEGNEVNKKWLTARSVAYGVVLALATSELFKEIGDTQIAKDLANSAGEKFSGMMGGIKSLFGFTPDTIDAAPVVAGVVAPEVTPDVITPEVVKLPEYTIEQGDNLTNIIKNEVISKIPGAENLTDFQKENMIQNLLKQASDNPSEPSLATINQFTNPNVIYPGRILDLDAIKGALTSQAGSPFDGETLLEHASKLSGNVAPPVANVEAVIDSTLPSSPEAVIPKPADIPPVVIENTPPVKLVDITKPAPAIPVDETIVRTGSGGMLVDSEGNPVRSTNFGDVAQQPISNLSNIAPNTSVSPELSEEVKRLAALAKTEAIQDSSSFADSIDMSPSQFADKLSSSGPIISPEFNTYFQKNFDTISDKDILSIKGRLLENIMNGKDQALKDLFAGKQPSDLKISPYLGNVELTVDTKGLVGVSFKPDGLVDTDLHKNGLAPIRPRPLRP